MHFSTILQAAVAGFVGLGASPVWAAVASRQSSGSIALIEGEPLFTFEYSTDAPSSTNWVGLYLASGGGPENEEYVSPSLLWEYAPENSGTIHLSTENLQPGSYRAFFLANDGYAWLAEPVDVELPGQTGPPSFIVDMFTTHNARQGDEFEATISGLLTFPQTTDVTFHVVGNDTTGWVSLASNGVISGTPGSSAQQTHLTVKAVSRAGDVSEPLQVTIPVRRSGQTLVRRLGVMSFNLWHGGTRVNDYHVKQVRYIAESGADIVGLQESSGGHATRLGNALGWYSWQGRDVSFLSRYPIVATGEDLQYVASARIALDGEGSQVNVWNVHLGYTPYGPYDFCFDQMSVERVMEREAQSGRTPQIINTMALMEEDLTNSNTTPIILLGDFNAPSHLDYTEELREKNCGYANIDWPTSIYPTDAGMIDTFRVAHPDPAAEQGITWSPIFLTNEGRPEPLDRIDLIYFTGRMSVISSGDQVVGNPTPMPNHEDNEWTSDHAAVFTAFDVQGSCIQRP
ncbi:hypothetical protein S7711_05913 [Stachybotrys chartarum IBT 7711]|uniref:Endonuclease/exonuclease/phosphatase domain-containing protein n=1 Tax=Stachybotrys chartarum (strain CBS 109288 / IBT 7711) TaxID=1280523 RepID=A0A084B193_STACB|nr:hypothetical protein S7711_05913 [Stachybotrys chartarum IBT 7711]